MSNYFKLLPCWWMFHIVLGQCLHHRWSQFFVPLVGLTVVEAPEVERVRERAWGRRSWHCPGWSVLESTFVIAVCRRLHHSQLVIIRFAESRKRNCLTVFKLNCSKNSANFYSPNLVNIFKITWARSYWTASSQWSWLMSNSSRSGWSLIVNKLNKIVFSSSFQSYSQSTHYEKISN